MTNNNDLIERYLYAITRRLPAAQRADVADELRTLISDMLDERCGGLAPAPKDVRVVLTELGTPSEMVRKYTDSERKCLIGQPYYEQYLFVLKIVLACVTGGMAVAGALSLAVGGGEGVALRVLEGIANWIGALAFAFSFVTVMFAIFYRKGVEVDVGLTESLDDLPPVPRESKTPTRGDAVAGIVFSIVGSVVFLLFPEVLNALSHGPGGAPVQVFDVAAIRNSAWVIVAWTLVCVASESFKLVEGRYTLRLLAVTLVANVLAAALAVFWLTSYHIVDTAALVQLVQSSADVGGPASWIFSHVQEALCALIVVALVIDAIEVVVRTIKARHS